ncbi:MAG TPA: hypothetical protein VEP90_16550 [Methylomirabilota bacterium]|nr:hypothetical protein [Methylomirabilota bacterium]
MTTEPSEPLTLFYSYDRRDEELREELAKHLAILRRKGYIRGIYNNNGLVYLQFWRIVFEHHAPRSLDRIEQSFTQTKQGNITREVSDELLNALTSAYRETADGAIEI